MWKNDEKDVIINVLVANPTMNFTARKSIHEKLIGVTVPGKTTVQIVQQAVYMIRRVRDIYRTRHTTGQGSTTAEIIGDCTTYGYDLLEPLVGLAQNHDLIGPQPGTSRSHNVPSPDVQAAPVPRVEVESVEEGPVELVLSVEDGPVEPVEPVPLVAASRSVPPATPNVAVRVPATPVLRAPRRNPQNTSLLHELRDIQTNQSDIFVAAQTTRRERLEVERGRLKVAEAKVEIKRKRLELQERRVDRDLALQERRAERQMAMEERRAERQMALDEKRFALEEKRVEKELDLMERKMVVDERKVGLEREALN